MDGFEQLHIETPDNIAPPSFAAIRADTSRASYLETLRTLYEGRGYEPHEIEAIVQERSNG